MKYEALLFDLDGTLIESIDLYAEACSHAFSAFDMHLSRKTFQEGYARGVGLEHWIEELGGDLATLTKLREKRDHTYIQLLREHTSFLPGAETLLSRTRHIPRAIVTGSWRTYIDAIHEKIQIGDHFEHIVTVDDMLPYYKPHPHGFLLAADRLGVDPEACLVIGDQTFDIDAAKAGGMRSCLIATKHTPEHARGTADHEVTSVHELSELLGLLSDGRPPSCEDTCV